MRRRLAALVLVLVAAVPFTAAGAERSGTPAWLAAVNRYRAQAGLPPVTEDPALSAADALHARYMVRNNVVSHHEDPSLPYFSERGDTAAENSNVIGGPPRRVPDHVLIDFWMTGPFHALGILRSDLETVGYSIAHDDKGMKTAAALDVGSGRNPDSEITEPVVWPGDGTTVRLRAYIGGEWPNPLSSCEGYEPPAGLPILFQLPSDPQVTSYSLTDSSGRELDVCEVDASNYSNDKASQEEYAKTELGDANAAFLIPRRPLKPGETYTATLTSNGETTTTTFTIAD